ncbi:hypothetical protein [Vibrio sp. SCSIO 43136]|uniref:hypothetical protein n=1 Tax=Vibrio sp. SCSIO 43136 TaxID=2819101 RepID=UPI002074ACD1|nr:hypothetical protein [Vibrio sp. SCSIO 43136]USD63978.1 hypothetical protein J4N39_07520 [Vibrio sp. SCSIO 43136]
MNRIIVTAVAFIVGLFSLVLGLVLTPFLALAAFLTGKKIKKQMEQSSFSHQFGTHSTVIEGEYEEVKAKQV